MNRGADLLWRPERPHFNPADQGALGHFQNRRDHLSNILRVHFPLGSRSVHQRVLYRRSLAESYTLRSFVAAIEQHRLTQSIEAELRGAVSRASRNGGLSEQTANIDDEIHRRGSGIA